MAKHLGALAGLVLASCVAPTDVALNAQAIAVAVVVGPGPERPIVSASVSSQGAFGVSVPADHALLIVEVPKDRLVDLQGDPLSDDDLSGVGAHLKGKSGPSEGCGRCPVPDFGERKVVVRGESCAPPRFSSVYTVNDDALETYEDPNALDRIRAHVRLDWPGPCEIDRPERVVPSELESPELVQPSEGWPFHSAWQTADGTIGLFSGAKTVLLHEARAPVELDDAFRGHVRAVAPLSDDSFIAFNQDALGADERRYKATRIYADGRRQPLTMNVSEPEFSEVPVMAVRGRDEQKAFFSAGPDEDLVFLVAQSKVMGASVYGCVVGVGSVVACRPLNRSDTLGPARFSDVAFTSDNSFVAVDFDYVGLGVRGDDGEWTRLRTERQDDSVTLYRAAWIAGSHLVVCGSENNLAYAKIAEVRRSDLLSGIAPTWTTVLDASHPGTLRGACVGFSHPAGRAGVLRMHVSGSRYFDLDDTGLIGSGDDDPNPGARVGTQYVEHTPADRLLVVDARGGVWTSATGTVAFERVYGPEPPYFHQSTSVLVDDRLITFGLRDGPLTMRAQDLDEGRTRWLPTTRDDSVKVMASAWDSLLGEAWVSGVYAPEPGDAPAAWLRRLEPDAPLENRVTFETDLPDRIREIAEVRPGVHIAIGDAWKIWRIEGDSMRPVEIDWDDPDTEAEDRTGDEITFDVLNREKFGFCDLRSAHQPWLGPGTLGAVEVSWNGLSVRDGVAWIVGCSGAIARVVTSVEPWRAQRIAFSEAPQAFFWESPPHFDAVHALAADFVVIGSAGSDQVYSEIGYTWIVRDDGARFVFEELDRSSPPRNSVNLPSSQPLEFVSAGSRVVTVFEHGAVLPLYGETIFKLRTTITGAHRTTNDELLLVDDARAYRMRFKD